MEFNNTLLSTADQAALAAAIAAIPAVLTPLNTQITAATTAAAPVVSLQSEIASALAALPPAGGMLPLSINELVQKVATAEAACVSTAIALYAACQNCEPLAVQQILPIAVRQGVTVVQNANAGLISAGTSEFNAGPLGSTFVTGMGAYFRSCFGPRENSIVLVLAKATKLQTLLQSIESGTDFYSLS